MNAAAPAPPGGRRGHMLVAFALGAALVGFLIGTGHGPSRPLADPGLEPRSEAEPSPVHGEQHLRVAPTYSSIERGALGANADWRAVLDPARHGAPRGAALAAFYGSAPATPVERDAALAARSELRAYRGAPPVVPHSIDQRSAASCLVCHGEGLRVGEVIAPAMSHALWPNCTQCHVESSGAPPRLARFASTPAALAPSAFGGLDEPGAGSRAWPGAPPTIPHSTWMREACISCHGTLSDAGLRASHPWRASCTQCHAPSAALDQMPVPLSPLPILR